MYAKKNLRESYAGLGNITKKTDRAMSGGAKNRKGKRGGRRKAWGKIKNFSARTQDT